jgi:hypothetical protein
MISANTSQYALVCVRHITCANDSLKSHTSQYGLVCVKMCSTRTPYPISQKTFYLLNITTHMNLYKYTATSLQIFIVCFILGTFIDKQIENIQTTFNIHPLLAAFIQLLLVILFTYFIYTHHKSITFFEYYSPHLIFSSILFGLQPNLMNNLRKSLF